MKKESINQQNDKLKELFSDSKIKASENLKFRIMHQIKTEEALSKKRIPQTQPLFNNMFVIFGVMYAIIGIIGFGIYFNMGKSALESKIFYIPAILITFICALYWMITAFDEQRQSKHKK